MSRTRSALATRTTRTTRTTRGTARATAALALGVALALTGCGAVDAGGNTGGDTGGDASSSSPTSSSSPSSSSPSSPGTASPSSPAESPSESASGSPSDSPTEPGTPTGAPTPGPTAPPVQPPATPDPTTPPAPAVFGAGDSGDAVLAVQNRLSELGYWLGTPDGTFGSLTTQAVYALQGAAGLQRDGRVGAQTRAALDAGTVPAARSTTGHVTEIDRESGVILFVDDGVVSRVLHTSTGTFEHYEHDGRELLADTPEGDFTVDWVHQGWREGDLGRLYAPRYFHPDGIAVHGYSSVPAQPASHGCARVTMAAMDMIWAEDLMPMDSEVLVY